jgi:hypothetical protein
MCWAGKRARETKLGKESQDDLECPRGRRGRFPDGISPSIQRWTRWSFVSSVLAVCVCSLMAMGSSGGSRSHSDSFDIGSVSDRARVPNQRPYRETTHFFTTTMGSGKIYCHRDRELQIYLIREFTYFPQGWLGINKNQLNRRQETHVSFLP